MSENPVELIVAAFGEENAAKQALKELKAAKRAKPGEWILEPRIWGGAPAKGKQ